MHVELADLFRCPAHAGDGWLVVAAERTQHRVVMEGVLGCPTCGAEYPIRGGVTRFAEAPVSPSAAAQTAAAHGPAVSDVQIADDGMRAAALLGALDSSATLAVHGSPIALAREVQRVVPARCIVLDAPDAHAALDLYAHSDAPLAVVVTGGRAVIAPGSLTGLWWSEAEPASPPLAVLESLRPRARLVASASVPVPDGFIELARDSRQWVAERSTDMTVAPSGLTQLRRRR